MSRTVCPCHYVALELCPVKGDIVARLREYNVSWSQQGEDCAEAADEIERLRARVKELESPLCSCATCGKCSGRAAANALEARVAQLEAQLGTKTNNEINRAIDEIAT